MVERVEAAAGQQLGPQGFVEPFDLAGGGGAADPGEQVGDPLLAADAVEQHLTGVGAEAAGEDLAIVSQQLLWAAMAVQGSPEHPADGPGVGPLHQPGGYAEPGVVVDAGHGLEFVAIGQPDPTHDVHLPQLHGPAAFPAAVVGLWSPSWLGLDEAVTDQRPVDAGQAGWRVEAATDKFVGQAALAPAWMVAAQFAQASLDRGRHLVRAAVGAMGAVGERVQPAGGVTAQPAVDSLAADARSARRPRSP